MRVERNRLPIKNGLLPRPRLQTLLNSGLEHPLITVVAGPGYGKTQTLAAFAKTLEQHLIWMHIVALDNHVERFWQNFLECVRVELPILYEKLFPLGFPGTLEKQDMFLRWFTSELYAGEHIVFVVDDYNNIKNPNILQFFKTLIDAKLENLCIVLASNEKSDLNVGGLRDGGSLLAVTMDDLRFTRDEINQYLLKNDIQLSSQQVTALEEDMDGWPLALHYYVTQYQKKTPKHPPAKHLALAAELFENEYFASYSDDIQILLIKLSLFPTFSVGIIKKIYDDAKQAVSLLSLHMFISYDYAYDLFVFQKMYRNFLKTKQELLEEKEIARVYNVAGDWFLENDHVYEALESYYQCKNYDGMTQAVMKMPEGRPSVTTTNQILSYLNEIPLDYRAAHPITEFLRAYMYLNGMEVHMAQSLLRKLTQDLAGTDSPELQSLSGEAYALLADLDMLTNQTNFCDLYRKASELLPDGSQFRPYFTDFLDNNDFFYLPNNKPGQLDTMVDLVFKAMPYVERVSLGFGHGVDWLFAAEAAFLSHDFKKAKEFCYKTIYKASEKQQYDIVCNAYYLLLRIALYYGDYDDTQRCLHDMEALVRDHKYFGLVEIKETIESWYSMQLGNLDNVSPWLSRYNYTHNIEMSISIGRNILLYAYYQLKLHNFLQTITILEQMEKIYEQKSCWTMQLTGNILKAICYLKINKPDKAMQSLWRAYGMSWQNSIITPFIEFGNNMRSLIDIVYKNNALGFDETWLNDIYNKSSSYAKRCASLSSSSKKENIPPAAPTLSKREIEVLHYLAQGLTRVEIAELIHISVNGVKKHITGIYNKLGAINRVDAIRIASTLGYFS